MVKDAVSLSMQSLNSTLLGGGIAFFIGGVDFRNHVARMQSSLMRFVRRVEEEKKLKEVKGGSPSGHS